jgi:hypothetical protein
MPNYAIIFCEAVHKDVEKIISLACNLADGLAA